MANTKGGNLYITTSTDGVNWARGERLTKANEAEVYKSVYRMLNIDNELTGKKSLRTKSIERMNKINEYIKNLKLQE